MLILDDNGVPHVRYNFKIMKVTEEAAPIGEESSSAASLGEEDHEAASIER